MLKSLLSVCSIFVLLLPNLFLPNPAAACPVKLPETLLSLYRNSDAIYVGRFDKVEDHEVIENSDELTVVNIKKHFDISSTLKGDSRKLFVLEDKDYRYKSNAGTAVEQSEESEEPSVEQRDEEEDDRYRAASLKSGDLVLLFLKKGEDGTLGLTDYRDAIKKMTPERLEVYEARIRELNSIFSGKKADDAAIVDWLVRCAEDAATRWEGAFELQQSFQRLEWMEQQKAEAEEESEEEEAEPVDRAAAEDADVDTEAEGEAEAAEEESDEVDNSVYAKLLNDGHKQALMNTLLASTQEASEPGKAKPLTEGDRVLIELVSKWGDNRFARFSLDRLQSSSGDPYVVSELMSSVATILADSELEKLAGKYSDSYYQDDADLVDEDEDSDSSGEDEEKADSETPTEVESSGSAGAKPQPEKAVVPKITYKQLRDELLAKFIERSVAALAIAESQKEERVAR